LRALLILCERLGESNLLFLEELGVQIVVFALETGDR
jgi:hypothetical protein